MPGGRTVVGEAFVGISPSTAGFAAKLTKDITPALQSAGTAGKVPITAETSQFTGAINKATASAKTKMMDVAKYAGLALGGAAVFGLLKDSVDLSRDAQHAQLQTNLVFGQGAGTITAWAQGAVQGMGMTSAAAETLAAKQSQIMEGFGLSQQQVADQTAALVKRQVDLASESGSTVDDVSTALDSALAGRTRGLKQYGVIIDSAMIKAKAAQMGLTKTDIDPLKVAAAQDAVARAQNELNSAQRAAKDPNALALANNRVALAYSAQQKALHGAGGSGSAAYLRATDDLMTQQDALATLQEKQGNSADVLKEKQDALTAAQSALNDATQGTTDALTPEAQAQATLALFMDKSTIAAGVFGQTNADQAQVASASWDTAKTKIGDAVNPIITKLTVELGGWVTAHEGDIEHFAELGAQGLQKVVDVVQWLLDHKAVLLTVLGAFAVIHEVGDQNSALNKLWTTVTKIQGWVTGGSQSPASTAAAAETSAVARSVAQMTVEVMTVNMMEGAGLLGGGAAATAERELTTDGSLAADRALMTQNVKGATTDGVVAGEKSAATTAARSEAGGAMAVSMGSKMANMGMGAMLAAAFVPALFAIAADNGWVASANPIASFNSAANRMQGGMTGNYTGDEHASPGEIVRLFMENRPDLANVQQAVTSQNFSDLITQGGPDAKSELEQYALFAKDQASKTTGAEQQHWQRYADMFDALNKLVDEGAIKTQGQLNDFLSFTGTLTEDVWNFESALHLTVYEATQALHRIAASVNSITATDTTGTRGAQLDAGVGDIRLAGTATRLASGAYSRVPTLAVVGDATGGEWTLRQDQLMQALVATAAQSSGGTHGAALSIGEVNVVHPTSDVDPITAIQRALWHATYDERGFRPSDAGYRADQLVGGTRR